MGKKSEGGYDYWESIMTPCFPASNYWGFKTRLLLKIL